MNYNTLDHAGNGANSDSVGNGICGYIENLSTVANLIKAKKPNLTKSKKTKNMKFAMVHFFRTDFLTLKAKEAFIHL